MGPGKKMTATTKPAKKIDPNVSTRNYNAATGITHEFIQDDAGNYVTPGYDFEKAPQYEANAIKKYGSLEASRKFYASRDRAKGLGSALDMLKPTSPFSKSRCWTEYEPVPGKKPYTKGSCRKK